MSKKPTLTQIGEKAGVSIATVSRVLSGKDPVSPVTRQKVLQAMRELEHGAPQKTAPASGRKILVLLPDFENPFYAPIIQGIQQTARSAGHEVFLVPTGDSSTHAGTLTALVHREGYAGVIWLCAAPEPELLSTLDAKCPSVMVGEYPEGHEGSYVSIDDRMAGYRAVNYLISTGCRKIGMVNCAFRYKYARHRKEGYQKALTEAQLPVDPNWYVSIPAIDYTLAYSAVMQVLCTEPRPDALFASSDVLAAAAINAAHSLGLRVPEDLCVIGFDNVEASRMTLPAITTVSQPTHQLGQQACSILLDRIRDPELPHRQILLDTELVIRGSTK